MSEVSFREIPADAKLLHQDRLKGKAGTLSIKLYKSEAKVMADITTAHGKKLDDYTDLPFNTWIRDRALEAGEKTVHYYVVRQEQDANPKVAVLVKDRYDGTYLLKVELNDLPTDGWYRTDHWNWFEPGTRPLTEQVVSYESVRSDGGLESTVERVFHLNRVECVIVWTTPLRTLPNNSPE